jgi:hypothetical protein
MKPNSVLFVEFLFFDFAAVGFGVWQWWSVRPKKVQPPKAETSETTSPENPGHSER